MFSFSNISLSVTSFHTMSDSEKIITCNLIINEYHASTPILVARYKSFDPVAHANPVSLKT